MIASLFIELNKLGTKIWSVVCWIFLCNMLAGQNLAQMYPNNQALHYSNVNVKQEQRGFAGESYGKFLHYFYQQFR